MLNFLYALSFREVSQTKKYLSSYFSVDGDSDSMSECRGLSPSMTELPGIEKLNGFAHSNSNHNQTNGRNAKPANGHYQNGSKCSATTSGHSNSKAHFSHSDSCSSSSGSCSIAKSSNGEHKVCDMNGGTKELTNGFATANGSQGSPLRSQLGLNLKSNAPATSKQSPMLQVKDVSNGNSGQSKLTLGCTFSVPYVHTRQKVQAF